MSEMYRNVASHEVTKVSKWIPQSRYHSPLCRCQSRHKALQNQDNQNHKGLGALGQNSMAFAKDFLKKDESSLMFSVLPSDDCVQAMLQNGIQMALPCRIRIWPINVKRVKISVILLVSWMCSWKWPSLMIFRIPAVKTPPHFSSALQTARASFRASFSARLGPWTALTHDLFQGNHHFYRWYMVV